MDPEKLDKICKLLDRSEQEFKKLLEYSEVSSKRYLHEQIQKGIDLYTVVSSEFANYCYLNCTDKERNVVIQISRGYNSLLNELLKILLIQLTKKANLSSPHPEKLSSTAIQTEDASILQEQKAKPVAEKVAGGRRIQHFQTTLMPITVSVPNEVIKEAPIAETSTIHSRNPTLLSPQLHSPQLLPLAKSTSERKPIKTMTEPQFAFLKNSNSMIVEDVVSSPRKVDFTLTSTNLQNQSECQLDPEEKEQQQQQSNGPVEEGFEDLQKRKELLEKLGATGSAVHLEQVLKNLARSKRRQKGFLKEELDLDEDELDFEAIQDDLVRAYDGAQRKTANRVLKYVTKKEVKETLIKRVWKHSVGTEPDYGLIEAERQALLKTKDDEYEKLVYTKESENKNLKERVEELQQRLADAVTELLELKVKKTEEELSQNVLQKQLRELIQENKTLTEKLGRKEMKIKSFKDDMASQDDQAKGIVDILARRNNTLVEENRKLETSCLEMTKEIASLKEEIGKLKQMVSEKCAVIEDLKSKTSASKTHNQLSINTDFDDGVKFEYQLSPSVLIGDLSTVKQQKSLADRSKETQTESEERVHSRQNQSNHKTDETSSGTRTRGSTISRRENLLKSTESAVEKADSISSTEEAVNKKNDTGRLNGLHALSTNDNAKETSKGLDILYDDGADPVSKIKLFLEVARLNLEHLADYLASQRPATNPQTNKTAGLTHRASLKSENKVDNWLEQEQEQEPSLTEKPITNKLSLITPNTPKTLFSRTLQTSKYNSNSKSTSHLFTKTSSVDVNSQGNGCNNQARTKKFIGKIFDKNNIPQNDFLAKTSIDQKSKDYLTTVKGHGKHSQGSDYLLSDSTGFNNAAYSTSYPSPRCATDRSASGSRHYTVRGLSESIPLEHHHARSLYGTDLLSQDSARENLILISERSWGNKGQDELQKTKEEQEFEYIFGELQQKAVLNPRIKKIFKKTVMINNPRLTEQDAENGNFEVDFKSFKDYVKEFKVVHSHCGENCPHLKRFYENIGYMKARQKRPQMAVHVTDIERLPKINYYQFKIQS